MRLRVGDFVRFTHTIAMKHGGVLASERAIVVGLEVRDKYPVARLVWDDGESGLVRVDKLTKTEGKAGSVVGDRKKPVKDWGHKPVPTPPRAAIPAPLTSGRSTCWAITDEYQVKGFPLPPKPGDDKPGFMLFKVPIVVIEVRASHWAKGNGVIKLSRSDRSLTVTHPDGSKKSMTPSEARNWVVGKFGPEMAATLVSNLRLAPENVRTKPADTREGRLTKVNCPVNFVPQAYAMGNRKVDTASRTPNPNSPTHDDSWKVSAHHAKTAHNRFSAELDRMLGE